ncbi:MAG: hypothetical protein IJN09_06025 [Oscillospiraceae bacterium]|nr:hypothetical protein [Oscillospiraceae bacterium]
MMLSRIFQTHKKLCIGLITAFALVLLALYLYAAFLPGVWHKDAFLYRNSDGVFSGKNSYSEYEMSITRADTDIGITFRVNDTILEYRIVPAADSRAVEIFENGTSVFRGRAVVNGDATLLMNDEEGISDIIVTTTSHDDFFTVPTDEEQFPSYTALYNWTVRKNTDTRGNFLMIFLAALLAAILTIDVKYPDLFFRLRYGLHVDGGSPSDFYRVGQEIEKIISPIVIVGLLIAAFVVH